MLFLKSKRRLVLFGIDLSIFTVIFFLVLVVRFYVLGQPLLEGWAYAANYVLFAVPIFAARFALRIYSSVWRYANSMLYLQLVVADAVGGITATIVNYFIPSMHISAWITLSMITMSCIATLCIRFIYQQKHRIQKEMARNREPQNKIAVAILGAGELGAILADELLAKRGSHYRPACFIDVDRDKIGTSIRGIKVYGDDSLVISKLEELEVKEIFIAINNITAERIKVLYDFYSKKGYKVKVYDLPVGDDGKFVDGKRTIREFSIEDLLFRDSIKVVSEETREFYRDKTVLVTGGGGSIGSELSRQIAKCEPKRLIIFDIYENNAYDIQQELKRQYKDKLDLCVEIGSVRDKVRLECVFENYHPDIVFHAAAHKHVPLMEHSPCEAIKNNVMGTYNTANMAEKYGVKKFILISTDKAVNPTNVMGASKRLCEMVVLSRKDSETSFSAVRFGNVLGSNGSVIPLFKRQIAEGGPLTITDKRIIRYFMTIPEASGLVMQAGAMAKRGELFVLDMGKPVKILDLAENMITLSGYTPYLDIDIVETGLRPGEKLYEELLMKTETLAKTDNDMIFIEEDTPPTREELEEKLAKLSEVVKETEHILEADKIREVMMQVVPTFRPPEEVNRTAATSAEMLAIK